MREFTRLRDATRDYPTFGLENVCVFAPHFRIDVHSGKRNMEDLSTARDDRGLADPFMTTMKGERMEWNLQCRPSHGTK